MAIANSRDLIFISHANPADNEFVVWLGGRLSSMGYRTWADLQDLKGGSKHWSVIEDKIRNEASKVLVVTTRSSRKAEGVDNEINIAKGIEKELSLKNFIIQLKMDDLPYNLLPPALNNRLAIEFTSGWQNGLSQLVSQLNEEKVPRYSTAEGASTQLFSTVLRRGADRIVEKKEPSFANWLPVTLPEKLHVYTFRGSAGIAADQLNKSCVPAADFGDTVVSFAVPDAVAYGTGLAVEDLRHLITETTIWRDDETYSEFAIPKDERRRTLNKLLNVAWETALRSSGFLDYRLANERAQFLGSSEVVKQSYQDPLRRLTRPVTLVGISAKYECFWHAALSARAGQYPWPRYGWRLHVAFTKDGHELLADGERAFRLRRTFCRSFWNDRWRRLLFALFARLSADNESIVVPTGGDESILVRFPQVFSVPYSIGSDVAMDVNEQIDDEDLPDSDDVGSLFDDAMDDLDNALE